MKTIWLTVALFDAKVAHVDALGIRAHTNHDDAVKAAFENVSSARDMSYKGTGTAIFEVELDGGSSTVDVLLHDKGGTDW